MTMCKLKLLPLLAIVVLMLVFNACKNTVGHQEESGEAYQSESNEFDEIKENLSKQKGGKTPSDPIELKVSVQLTEANWVELLGIFDKKRLYISLDLSECDYSDSSSSSVGGLNKDRKFNPISSISIGKDRIVNFIFPVAAKEISGSFANFSSLRTIYGENVNIIPSSTFAGNSTLVSANFPQATSIGGNAFQNCVNLVEMPIPATAAIAGNPFIGCSSLIFSVTGVGNLSTKEDGKALIRNQTELLSFPAASGSLTMDYLTVLCDYSLARTSITEGIFNNVLVVKSDALENCNSLMKLSLPKVEIINSWGLYYNANLTQLNIPSVVQIDNYALASTGNTPLEIIMGATAPSALGTSIFSGSMVKTVKIRVPAGSIGYDTTWKESIGGKGSSGTGTVNANLTLIIEETM